MNFIFFVSLSVYIYTANVLEKAKKKVANISVEMSL